MNSLIRGEASATVQVMGIDAGGTMTDTFFVREDGHFIFVALAVQQH